MGINSFNAFILYPVAKAFDPTVGFGMIWRFSCDGWQLITSRLYNACYHRGQRGQHASKVAFWFSRKQLFHGHSDGTIYAWKVLGLAGSFMLVGLLVEGFSIDTFALPYYWVTLGLVTAACAIGDTV